MKKRFLFVFILLELFIFGISYGEDITVVYVPEADVRIALPVDYMIVTRSTPDDDPLLKKLGINAKDLMESMELYNEYLDAIAPDFSNEIALYVENTKLENINFALDALIVNLADSMEQSYDRSGLVSEGYDLVTMESCRVVKLFSYAKDNPQIHRLMYYTIQNYKDIKMVFCSYNSEVSYKDEIMMDKLFKLTLSYLLNPDQDNSVSIGKTEIVSGSYSYIENADGTVSITNYDGDLKEVLIPSVLDGKKVSGLGYGAFSSAKNMETVELPQSIVDIDGNPFSGCRSLKNIKVDSENVSFTVRDGFLLSNDMKSVISAPIGDLNKISYSVPQGVEEIKPGAFAGYTIFDLVLPSSLKYIGESAFSESLAFRTMIIPNSVVEIGEKAFFKCYTLSRCILPKRLTAINRETFYSCLALTEIDIPKTVISLGVACFRGSGLTEVELPDALESIPDYAFANCANLSKVIVPGSVSSISDSAFIECADDLTLYVSDESYALSYAKRMGLKYIIQNDIM